MMFSNNQILEVSGDLYRHTEELFNALEFALKASGDLKDFTRTDRPSKCVWQITEDGRYCIGWNGHGTLEKGWNEFQFDFDLDMIAQIIAKHLEKQTMTWYMGDGIYHKGFLMKTIPAALSNKYDGVVNPFYGIVSFEPYTCFYSKYNCRYNIFTC